MMFMSYADIMQEFKKPLHYKINKAAEAIEQGFAVSRHKQALAFSGGKDSTVLWHIIRSHFPGEAANMEIIYGNTGIEYPESLRFARRLGNEWASPGHFHETRPEKTAEDGLKYAAQREVLEWLSENGRLLPKCGRISGGGAWYGGKALPCRTGGAWISTAIPFSERRQVCLTRGVSI